MDRMKETAKKGGETVAAEHSVHPSAGVGGRWHKKYRACKGCGTTERPHYSLGQCEACYQTERRGYQLPGGDCTPCYAYRHLLSPEVRENLRRLHGGP